MSTKSLSNQESTARVRPKYIPLGVDATTGHHHVYRTTDETIHVIADGSREFRHDLGERDVDDWMDFIAQRRGWTRRDYGLGIVELLARAVDA